MTTTYAVLLPGDESYWSGADPARRAEGLARHTRFTAVLAERGHAVVAGAELAHSSGARQVRSTPGGAAVTDGPYAETAEQLTGFYLVASSDLDDLVDAWGLLAGLGHDVEIRSAVDHSAPIGAQS